VRELENIISRAILKASKAYPKGQTVVIDAIHLGGDISIEPAHMPQSISETAFSLPPGGSLRQAVEDFQRNLISYTLASKHGNWAAAARDLGMHRSNLHNLATRLGLRPKKK
jgi:anaerobic nitric oxide reductase transcription regulator